MRELYSFILHLRLTLGDPPSKARGCCVSTPTSNKRGKKAKAVQKHQEDDDEEEEEDEEQEGNEEKEAEDAQEDEDEEEEEEASEDPMIEVKPATPSSPNSHKRMESPDTKHSPCSRIHRKMSMDDAELVVVSEGKSKERLELDDLMAKIKALQVQPVLKALQGPMP